MLSLHYYPQELISKEDTFRLLNSLIQKGGKFGIFILLFGENAKIPYPYGDKPPMQLDLDSLGAKLIKIDREGHVSFEEGEAFCDFGLDVEKALSSGALRARYEAKSIIPLRELLAYGEKEPLYEGISIPIGRYEDGGETYCHTLRTEKSPRPFSIVIGASNGGKSIFLHNLMLSAAYRYSPEEVEFHIVDFKVSDGRGSEFSDYRKGGRLAIPHVRFLSLQSKPESAKEVLDYINALIDKRSPLGKFRDYNLARVGNEESMPPMPFSIVLIDEFNLMINSGPSSSLDESGRLTKKLIEDGIVGILKKARTYGVALILSGQVASIPQDGLAQIDNRIAFKGESESLRSLFFHDPSTYREGISFQFLFPELYAGHAYVSENSTSIPRRVFMGYAGDLKGKEIEALAEEIRQKYKDFDGKQILVGSSDSVYIEEAHPFLSFEQEQNSLLKLSDSLDEGRREGILKRRNVPLGKGSTSGLDVGLFYESDVNATGYTCYSSTRTLLSRVLQNATYSFLHQTANSSLPKSKVIYLGFGENAFEAVFPGFLEGYPSIKKSVVAPKGHLDAGRLLSSLYRDLDHGNAKEPTLVLLYGLKWISSKEEISKWLEKGKEPSSPSSEPLSSLSESDVSSLGIEGEDLDFFNSILAKTNFAAAEETMGFQEEFTPGELLLSIRRLFLKGSKGEIYLLLAENDSSLLSEFLRTVISPSREEENRMKARRLGGNMDEIALKPSGGSSNVCTILSPEGITRARLFRYEAERSAPFFLSLEKALDDKR